MVVRKTRSFFLKCKRVWHSLKKPSKVEFSQTAKIAAIGVGLIGAVGFLISIIMKLFI